MKKFLFAGSEILALVIVAIAIPNLLHPGAASSQRNSPATDSAQSSAPPESAPAPQAAAQTSAPVPDSELCVEGNKNCEADAMGVELGAYEEDTPAKITNYSCPNEESDILMKIVLFEGNTEDGSKLDVASVNAYQEDQKRWGAAVWNPPAYGEHNGKYHLRGDRQFENENADITLELTPLGRNQMEYFISAQRSGAAPGLDGNIFAAQGTCTRVATKDKIWATTTDAQWEGLLAIERQFKKN